MTKLAVVKDDQRSSPFEIASDMEDDVGGVRDLSRALFLMGEGLSGDDASAVQRLARELDRYAELIEVRRAQIFHLLHPNRPTGN